MKILKIIREKNNLSREKLCKIIGINKDNLLKYENESINPPHATLIKLYSFFNYSIDYLIREEKTSYPKNLKLLELAGIIDKHDQESKIQIKNTSVALLRKYQTEPFILKQDVVHAELTDSFNKNLHFLRNYKKMTQEDLGKDFNISRRMISGYEKKNFPPLDKLTYLADQLEVSIHCLVTGQKLSFKFEDQDFGETILKADHFLGFDEQKMLIQLMETFLNA